MHLIVDAANVVGSRPDGWWHDRPGAARRLAAQLVSVLASDPAALARLGEPDSSGSGHGSDDNGSDDNGGDVTVHLVLEGAAKGAAADLPPQLTVVLAPADGDAAIVEVAAGLSGATVVVVTADQGLRRRVQRVGATVIGPRVLRAVLPEAGLPEAGLPEAGLSELGLSEVRLPAEPGAGAP